MNPVGVDQELIEEGVRLILKGLGEDQVYQNWLESPQITIPDDHTTPRIWFDHNVGTEKNFDGGNVQLSVNDGEWQVITETHFIYNAYNAALNLQDNTNPLAGQPAFTGVDEGQQESRWGQSQIDLSDLAQPGDTIQMRSLPVGKAIYEAS